MKLYHKIINIFASLVVVAAGLATITLAEATELWLDFSVPAADVVPNDSGEQDTSEPAILLDNSSNGEMSAAKLFATTKSPGSIAIGVAEGNLTVTGEITSLYWGHTDPGNHVTNRGFCSWNRAKNLTVAQADRRCLAALQRQGAATEKKLQSSGVDPKIHLEALVNGTDLWNQSNLAGRDFSGKYKQAIDKGLIGKQALIDARVEAFRNEAGKLDASGLFGICAREGYYQKKLAGLKPYSESWRWQCIAMDQGRRVAAVGKALKQNLGDITASVETSHTAPNLRDNSTELPRPPTPESRDAIQLVASLDFSVPDESVEEMPPVEAIALDELKPQQTDVFSGKRITKAGGAIGMCAVTDYRRYRYIHPVLGIPPGWHNGVDVACPQGAHAVYSPADGKLSILPPNRSGGGGLVARIKTDDGWIIQNMHMVKITAKPGKIRAGQKLGIGGAPFGDVNAGTSTGPHSHYERFKVVKGDRKYVNPTDKEVKALLGIEP